ncbi:MAG: ATP-dependent helicase/nuclease subunit A [Eubacteriales bacterium SKADARSKE-1]|nr:ATP-dependent helicase/nuclease subunit A [Eubacteriales bacterium SKADARSKE-1]
MATRKWTENQAAAINSRKGSILVSAAAGSGKTAVLVQRVIESLTDKENPVDADKLLVVTFTNAAAAEMKSRISSRISELLLINPLDENLKRQQLLLKNSHISTIHSFCSDLIRENFFKLNISPDFKIADSNEILLLKSKAINEVLEEKYAFNSKQFLTLVEAFSRGRNDSKLIDIINLLYEFVRSHPFPKKWLNDKLNMYNANVPVKDTVFGKTLITHAKSAINHCIELIKYAIFLTGEDEAFENAYKPTLNNDLLMLNEIQNTLTSGSWDEISNSIHVFKLPTLKRLTGFSDDPIKLKIMANRQEVKDIFKKLNHFFITTENECKKDTEKLKPIVQELFSVIELFSEKFDHLKSIKNLVDFGDLEHLALKLLVKPTASGFEKTAEALELCEKFQQVMVDEYQDTNEAQDMIFRAVSNNESNFFMVGDVKQSIYRFRQAMPEIFLRRKESYENYDPVKDNYPSKIILDKNFRSRSGVLSSVNFIFHQLMSKSLGDMDYTKDEELKPGAKFFQKDEPDTELKIIDLSESDEKDIDIVEARYISELICKMIKDEYKIQSGNEMRSVTYGDFCVLLRSTSRHAEVFAEEMKKCGVPAFSDINRPFLSTSEIKIIISLLKIINNPIDDISILSVLLSPIENFTLDEIVKIRIIDKEKPIYMAIKKASANGNKKCEDFLFELENFRKMSSIMSISKFISYIYENTEYPNIVQVLPDGQTKLNNLYLFLEYAKNYETSSSSFLCDFIGFIDNLIKQNADLAIPATASAENTVKIMSIHRSKGLEFPICIMANCSRQFNKDKDDILLHPSLGIGIKLFDNERLCRYSTLQREAVKLTLETDSLSEELRVLYVALTRAREKLIMVTTLKNPQKELNRLSLGLTEQTAIAPYTVKEATSFSDWILSCALKHPSGGNLRTLAGTLPGLTLNDDNLWSIEIAEPKEILENTEIVKEEVPIEPDKELLNKITKKINYKYPLEGLSNIPCKLSVTDIIKQKDKRIINFKKPTFITGKKFSPSEKGTAFHTFMQFADYKKAQNDLPAHIEDLISKGFLKKEQAECIDKQKLEQLLKSKLMERILKSSKVLREYKFTTALSPKEYDNNLPNNFLDQKIILNGTVDCLFLEDNEFVLVDYKTNKINSHHEIINLYKKQLELYKKALAKCTSTGVKQSILYLFYTNEQIFL